MASDLYWATNRLSFGAKVDSLYDVKKIASQGITHVINLRAGEKEPDHVMDEVPWWNSVGIKYSINGTHDDGEKKPTSWFEKTIKEVLGLIAQDPENKIMIHCKAGYNRSPSMVYACLRAWGTNAENAIEQIKETRKQVGLAYVADADKAIKELKYL